MPLVGESARMRLPAGSRSERVLHERRRRAHRGLNPPQRHASDGQEPQRHGDESPEPGISNHLTNLLPVLLRRARAQSPREKELPAE